MYVNTQRYMTTEGTVTAVTIQRWSHSDSGSLSTFSGSDGSHAAGLALECGRSSPQAGDVV